MAYPGDGINLSYPNSHRSRGRVGRQCSQTLMTGGSMGVLLCCRIRRLTPRECWRLQAFEDFMPEGTTWTRPQGGLFLWLTLPEGCNTLELFPIAIEEKVAYVPGASFYPKGGPSNTMRLNFSACNPETIRIGV